MNNFILFNYFIYSIIAFYRILCYQLIYFLFSFNIIIFILIIIALDGFNSQPHNNNSTIHLFYYLNIIYSHLMSYSCPININYLWNNGFFISMFFIFQIITGIILSIIYTNDVTFAYYSISHIIREVYSGFSFRYIHSQGASFVFALYYIHIARSLIYSSCLFFPSIYYFGIILYIIIIIIAFIGYLLPWGQMSFWGATVITNILFSISIFLYEWICGGYFISNPTLKRFFVIHFILPFLSFYLIFIHIFYLHLKGSNNPLGANNFIIFILFTFFLSKDFFGLFILLFLFLFQSHFGFIILSHPDNSIAGNGFLTPLHILPEWYFLPFYAILKAIPNKIAGFIILFYIILIFYGNSVSYSSSLSSLFTFIFTYSFLFINSFILLLLVLGWIGSQLPQEKFISYGRIFLTIILLFALYFLDINILPYQVFN